MNKEELEAMRANLWSLAYVAVLQQTANDDAAIIHADKALVSFDARFAKENAK
jgi:hypothetical protein